MKVRNALVFDVVPKFRVDNSKPSFIEINYAGGKIDEYRRRTKKCEFLRGAQGAL
jgi:hypothetical protein